MRYIIRHNIDNVEKIINKYPNKDTSKLIHGFDYDAYEIFEVIEDVEPEYDSNTHKVDYNYNYTDEVGISPNTKKVYKIWEVIQLSDDEIISNLNNSLGVHLDNQYPLWERAKHAGEGSYILWNKLETTLTQEELDRKAYIDATFAWITAQRAERDSRENELLTNGVLPSFIWEDRPTN
jgi:hypothetical protein